ncbi:hypothetical protein C7271_01615 [filamentous cyanobacterium CCP5]|nr:hypothetical protein C7271_01615 [filamentous cyanobacterium CCP5]
MVRSFYLSALAAVLGWGAGISGVWADGMPPGSSAVSTTAPTNTPPATTTGSAPTQAAPIDDYTRFMLAGYAAADIGDYQTALINFRRALAERPNNAYARAAIANMQTYIAEQRAEAARLQEIAKLQSLLQAAVDGTDWACAAATVDQLVMLVPPGSSDRAELIGFRGQLSGFLNARSDLDSWSTVCLGVMNPETRS